MHEQVLAAKKLRAQLKPVEPVQSPNSLLVHRPALSTQHHVDALVAEAGLRMRDLSNAKSQSGLILGRSLSARPAREKRASRQARTVAT